MKFQLKWMMMNSGHDQIARKIITRHRRMIPKIIREKSNDPEFQIILQDP